MFLAALAAGSSGATLEANPVRRFRAVSISFSLFARHEDLIDPVSSKRRAFREALPIQLIIPVFSDA
jgi:hypothetical protein